MNKLPEKIGILATDYPDFDYVIDQLMSLAAKQNEVIDYLASKSLYKKPLHPTQRLIMELATKEDIELLGLRTVGKKIGIEHPQKIQHHLGQLYAKGLLPLKQGSHPDKEK